MKDKWVKDVCPFAKDQNFYSVIGEVIPGETVFGFTITMSGASYAVDFATETAKEQGTAGKGTTGQRIIHQLENNYYRVFATNVSGGSEGAATYEADKLDTGFTFYGDNGYTYDIIVIGRVLF